jgi:hypothetical protein
VRQVLTLELVIVKEKKFWLRRCGLWPSFAYEVSLVAQHLLKLGVHLTTALARLQVQNLARRSSLEAGSTREKKGGEERRNAWYSAATLSQQDKNNSADLQRGRVNISGFICTVAYLSSRRHTFDEVESMAVASRRALQH